MSGSAHRSFQVYATETEIPGYQRAWVWGLAALVILCCGLTAGWLFNTAFGGLLPLQQISTPNNITLAQQERINEQLRKRITQLEQALNEDICN
ncbi:MAG: hypothetical protein CSA09_04005 [Candidatus Contendobacter odensis]|uniref:Uncharacterized protein n=1 Tax=Candidatus Contendibacter odensensis TaxID=1400860 RepID=A0A2G6PEM0_9GAMM|nr:MAG: hypothetical protein CSA09_04005 [Candidatus Contendobacter odensis]